MHKNEKVILSIIIVTYLSSKEIIDCLDSIPTDILGREVEVLIVENNSGDEINRIIKEYESVKFIDLKVNLGCGKANNIGFEESSGEFILFLNPDTIINREALKHCLKRIKNDESIGFITPKLEMLNGEMDFACRRSIPTIWDGLCRATGLSKIFSKMKFFSGYNLTHLPEDESYEVGAVNGAFMMISRKNLLRIGLFDEQYFMYGDDLDLCYRSTISGFKNVYDGTHKIIHIKGQSSSKVHEKMSKEVFQGTYQFYDKFFNPHNSNFVRLKYLLMFKTWSKISEIKSKFYNHKKAQPI